MPKLLGAPNRLMLPSACLRPGQRRPAASTTHLGCLLRRPGRPTRRSALGRRLILLGTLGLSLCVGLAAAGRSAVNLQEDAPPIAAPKAGQISGRITPPEKIALIKAICRETRKAHLAAEFDAGTGVFVFRNLPGDANYDVIIRTNDGRSIEGIDLDFADSRLLRLAEVRRKQLSLPPELARKFTPDDVRELTKYVEDLKDFMDIRRILYLRGHGRRATMLVELMRARDFYARRGGEVIWRIELWYFENHFGGWERTANLEKVLERRRITADVWRKVHVEYYPQLSIHVDAKGNSRPVEFKIPEKPDPSRGRAADTPVRLKTKPHVSGLDVDVPAATQPADRGRGEMIYDTSIMRSSSTGALSGSSAAPTAQRVCLPGSPKISRSSRLAPSATLA